MNYQMDPMLRELLISVLMVNGKDRRFHLKVMENGDHRLTPQIHMRDDSFLINLIGSKSRWVKTPSRQGLKKIWNDPDTYGDGV